MYFNRLIAALSNGCDAGPIPVAYRLSGRFLPP